MSLRIWFLIVSLVGSTSSADEQTAFSGILRQHAESLLGTIVVSGVVVDESSGEAIHDVRVLISIDGLEPRNENAVFDGSFSVRYERTTALTFNLQHDDYYGERVFLPIPQSQQERRLEKTKFTIKMRKKGKPIMRDVEQVHCKMKVTAEDVQFVEFLANGKWKRSTASRRELAKLRNEKEVPRGIVLGYVQSTDPENGSTVFVPTLEMLHPDDGFSRAKPDRARSRDPLFTLRLAAEDGYQNTFPYPRQGDSSLESFYFLCDARYGKGYVSAERIEQKQNPQKIVNHRLVYIIQPNGTRNLETRRR